MDRRDDDAYWDQFAGTGIAAADACIASGLGICQLEFGWLAACDEHRDAGRRIFTHDEDAGNLY
jgi:hypothetical protein